MSNMKMTKDQVAEMGWLEPDNVSSQIARVAWLGSDDELASLLPKEFSDDSAGALLVEFRSSATSSHLYVYDDVTQEQLASLLAAESAGRHLNQKIKPARAYARVLVL